MPVSSVLADHQVIEREQIEASIGMNLVELLGSLPGVQWVNTGGHGKASSLLLRGTESRHVLLLIDGVRFGSATLGLPSLENLPLDAIERVELVRGPMSALYGSDAVGGVLQIFTRAGVLKEAGAKGSTRDYRSSLQTGLGSAGFASLGWSQQWQSPGIVAGLHLSGLQSAALSSSNAREPWGSFDPDADRYRQSTANAQLGWQIAPQIRLDFGGLRVQGRTAIDDGPGVDSRASLLSQLGQVSLQGQITKSWQSRLRWSEAIDGYSTLSSASPWTELGETRTRSQHWVWEQQWRVASGLVQLHAENQQQTVSRPGEAYERSSRQIRAYGLGWMGQQGPHQWHINLRRDENEQFGSENTGAAAYGLGLGPWGRLRLSYGTSFVAPSFNQLYYPGFGNPELQAERGRSREMGWSLQQAKRSYSITYFQQTIRGYITAGPRPENLPYSEIDGVTVAASNQLGSWQWSAAYDWLDPRNTTASSANFGKLLPRRAQEQLRLSAQTRMSPWQIGAQFIAVGGRYDDQSNELRLPGFGRLDVYANRSIGKNWRMLLRLSNLSDQRYETAYGYHQQGRALFLGLNHQLR